MKQFSLLLLVGCLLFSSCKFLTYNEERETPLENTAPKISLEEVDPVENSSSEEGQQGTIAQNKVTKEALNQEETFSLANNLLYNGSFEDGIPSPGSIPDYWQNCGSNMESPPDLHISGGVAFEVSQKATSGNQYVGMVVRSNGTRECLFQELNYLLNPGYFNITIVLTRSEFYISNDRMTGNEVNYTTPVKLEIIGVTEEGAEFVIYTTDDVVSTDWIIIEDNIQIDKKLAKIKISPNYTGDEFYNGNVLIDKIIFSVD